MTGGWRHDSGPKHTGVCVKPRRHTHTHKYTQINILTPHPIVLPNCMWGNVPCRSARLYLSTAIYLCQSSARSLDCLLPWFGLKLQSLKKPSGRTLPREHNALVLSVAVLMKIVKGVRAGAEASMKQHTINSPPLSAVTHHLGVMW